MSRSRGLSARVRAMRDAARAALADPASLARRAAVSSLWRLGGGGFEQAMRLAGNLVLTRLLAPEDFGLMAMAMSLQSGLMMATDIGLNQSVIRSERGEDPRFLRTAWTIKVIRHAQLSLLFLGLAGLVYVLAQRFDLGDTVYADPMLPWVMAALALPLALKGLVSMNLALNERRMRMASFVLLNAGSQVVTLAAIIVFALIEPSVWALVWGGVIGSVIRVAASHIVIPGPRMGFLLDRDHAGEIWGYGKWLMGASFFTFFAQQGDRLIFGALLAPFDFGIYAVARLWVDAAAGMVTRVSTPVSLAALSEVRRERPKQLGPVFRRIRLLQNAVCIGAFGVLAVGGRPIVEFLYPPNFHAVGAVVILLAPLLLLRIWSVYGTLVLAMGDSRNFATVTALRCAALLVTVPAFFHFFGPAWAYFAVAINHAWGVPQQLRIAAHAAPVFYAFEMLLLAAAVATAAALTVLA